MSEYCPEEVSKLINETITKILKLDNKDSVDVMDIGGDVLATTLNKEQALGAITNLVFFSREMAIQALMMADQVDSVKVDPVYTMLQSALVDVYSKVKGWDEGKAP